MFIPNNIIQFVDQKVITTMVVVVVFKMVVEGSGDGCGGGNGCGIGSGGRVVMWWRMVV